jgi:hypothetical protein
LTSFPQVRGLADVQSRDGAADEHPLDLGGSLEDREVIGCGWLGSGNMFETMVVTWQVADEL